MKDSGLHVVIVLALLMAPVPRPVLAEMPVSGDDSACAPAPDVQILPPSPLSQSERHFVNQLKAIVEGRDLPAFLEVLTEDVLVSFGGNGGREEFVSYWGLETGAGQDQLWTTLDRLLKYPPQPDGGEPGMLVFPWYFSNWPDDIEAYDIYLAEQGTALRAGPDETAAMLAQLPFSALRYQPPEGEAGAVDRLQGGWLPVAAPGHCLAYVREKDVLPLLGPRIVAVETDMGWRIEAFVAGD